MLLRYRQATSYGFRVCWGLNFIDASPLCGTSFVPLNIVNISAALPLEVKKIGV